MIGGKFHSLKSIGFLFLLAILSGGCATTRLPETPAPAARLPPEALMTHRAIFTVRGRQFALTGYLAVSQNRGMRLIISESFGGLLADLLVKPDGSVHVMKVGTMLKPQWIQKYVAADLKCLFGKAGQPCPVQILSPDHFLLKRRFYKLDLRIVQTTPGPQPAAMFEETPPAPASR